MNRSKKAIQLSLIAAFMTGSSLAVAAPGCNPSLQKVTALQNLAFGTAGALAGGGTVDVAPTGFRSSTGNVYLLGGTWFNAVFQIEGCENNVVTITLPTTGEILRGAGGNKITINNFTSIPTVTQSYTLDATGIMTINVGASLLLNAFQAAGDYSGNIAIDVVYN